MNKFKLWQRIGVIFLALFTVGVSVFFAQPSDATSARNQEMLSLAIIDGVKTPQELGLAYLSEQPELIADAGLINAIRRVPSELAQTFGNGQENTPLGIPLGTNSPISIGRMSDGGQLRDSNYDAIGYIGADGQPKNITPVEIGDMANTEANNGGNLATTTEAQEVLVADASGMLAQSRQIPTFDLIVRNRRTSSSYLVQRVNANALCRDAINAVFNRAYRSVAPVARPRRNRPLF
ncbi:MAG: hypothetical protein JGK21_06645 [Microcoleus sp. PH2017_22_RUC_O_B]|uniref:hypothetical protein n=1 Tax=unclassified Microcoleus TaxID=2642155 RepID=UPI001DC3DBC0|nr:MULTISPECIES: hypothetical protein [unclassified Microcoleus]MCC3528026.1 hypothetical protein [Microcoleus sp. PH2017_21_RUC_O_A]MCC3540057.1 hypothetical protein [Microcoleus sp. PH2017_22_RUC_O_B]